MAKPLSKLLSLLAAIAALLQLGCAGTVPTIEPGAYQNRPDAAQVRIQDPGVVVFRAVGDWEAFWLAHHKNNYGLQRRPPPTLPYVDFRRNMLIGIFWGSQSGCRSNVEPVQRVGSIAMEGSDMVVDIQELGSLGMCRAMSWPLQFIEVPRVAGEVVFTGAHPADQ